MVQLHGKKLTAAEANRLRDTLNRKVPKKVYNKMSGRANEIVNAQADRYGLPLRGKTVDLHAVIRAFHDFIAANAFALSPKGRKKALPGDEEFYMASAAAEAEGEKSPALERWREWKAQMAELEFKEREGSLVRADKMRSLILNIAGHYRRAAEIVRKQHGSDAADIIQDALDSAQRELVAELGAGDGPDGDVG